MEIKKENAMELWKSALEYVKKEGSNFVDKDGRECIECYNLILCIENVRDSKIEEPMEAMADTKKWVYPSKEELVNVIFKENQAAIYDYTYGGRIFNFQNQFDQINNFIIPLLTEDANSRRAVVILYDPIRDSNIDNKNTPGIIYLQFRIIDEKLNLICHIRSNDLFFGWPANIYQLMHLLKFVGDKLKKPAGDMSIISNSAHIFGEDMEDIDRFLGV